MGKESDQISRIEGRRLMSKMGVASSQQQSKRLLSRMVGESSQQPRVEHYPDDGHPMCMSFMGAPSSQQPRRPTWFEPIDTRNPPHKSLGVITMMGGETSQQPTDSRRKMPREQRQRVHQGVTCDSCQATPVVGYRYKCQICPDFDLCQDCKLQNQHSNHPMILI